MRVCHKENVPHVATCNVSVTKRLLCGHDAPMKCSSSIHEKICNVPVVVTKDPCMHEFLLPCSKVQSGPSFPCSTPVSMELPCGHTQQVACCAVPETVFCRKEVQFQLSCSHFTAVACGLPLIQRNASLCKEVVPKQLLCEHEKLMECHENPSEVGCGLMTERILNCGHSSCYTCPGKPDEDFLCEEVVDRQLPCGHFQKMACSRPDAQRCIEEVIRTLECGHIVKTSCWNTSPSCLTEVEKTLMCGHTQLVPCCLDIDLIACKVPVEVPHPLCSHLQKVTCSVAETEIKMRDWKCQAELLKMLNCGHEMRLPCTQEVDETIVCTAMINLPCHHMVAVECKDRSREKCKIPCEVPVDCGHLCTLVCHDEKTPHNCQQNVRKQLGCGHFKVECYSELTISLYLYHFYILFRKCRVTSHRPKKSVSNLSLCNALADMYGRRLAGRFRRSKTVSVA